MGLQNASSDQCISIPNIFHAYHFSISDGTLNEVTLDSAAIMEGVTPSMVDMDVEKEKLCSLEDTTILGSFPPLPTQVTILRLVMPLGLDAMLENGLWFIRNNPLILKKWHLDENLLKEDVSTVLVWVKLLGVPVTAFSDDGLSGRSSFARVMIELRADVELKDNIIVAMPRIKGGGLYMVGEKKTLKKPSQTSRGVPIGPKIGFKPQKEYRPVSKKPTASSSGTNANVVNNGATSSGSSFMNVDNSSTATTLVIEKIRKFEELLTSRQAILVDEAGNPLKKVEFPGDYDSEDEVASVDNDMACSLASEKGRLWHLKFAGIMEEFVWQWYEVPWWLSLAAYQSGGDTWHGGWWLMTRYSLGDERHTSLPPFARGVEFYCCDYCGGLHVSSNCQSRDLVFYESNSYNNFDSSGFDQPPQYPTVHPPLHEMSLYELSIMMNLGTPTPEPVVNSFVYEESDDDIEVTPTYTPPLPFLTTMEPADTLLMGDEDSSTTPTRETDEFIKSSVNDLVPIPKESEVTSGNNLKCDMSVTILLPTTDVREENFDINSPLGEHVVDFLMENEDVADLPRHWVKQLFSYLVKHPSSTKRMSDEPLGDDLKLRSYDVTFSNSLFDFNDDFTLCNDNPLFEEEFEDISSLDHPKSAPLNNEPLGNHDSMSRSLETSDLNLEELTAEIGLDDSILTEIDDGYYDLEGYILFLEHLLIEETFSYPTPVVLPKMSTILVTPLLDSEHIFLRKVERFDLFFSLAQSGEKTRVMETLSFGFNHMPSPRPAAYLPKEVMYRYYHPHLTSVDGLDPEAKDSNKNKRISGGNPCYS
ncbi:NAC domain-containing protein [Tanacetum coccineum]